MKGVKHPIVVGSKVLYKSYQFLFKAEVIKINKKTFKLKCSNGEVNISKDKVASVLDICTVVWDSKKDPTGSSCYFDYINYPTINKIITDFNSPCMYHNI